MLRVVTHRDQRNKEIMGCDIHFFTERFTSSNDYEGPRDLLVDRSNRIDEIVDGKPSIERWVSADAWDIDDGDWCCVERYDGRNYYLFSILADVRNSGEEVIDYPRGIPLMLHVVTCISVIRGHQMLIHILISHLGSY